MRETEWQTTLSEQLQQSIDDMLEGSLKIRHAAYCVLYTCGRSKPHWSKTDSLLSREGLYGFC